VLTSEDILVAFTSSGKAAEIVAALPSIRQIGTRFVLVTCRRDSPLGRRSDVVVYLPIEREACPMNLIPTTSSTAMLAFGDALAITLLKVKGFTPEDFAVLHPGGELGKRLLTAEKVMRTGSDIPAVPPGASFIEILGEISAKRLGAACVVEPETNILKGIITDGDVRRSLKDKSANLDRLKARDILTPNPKVVTSQTKLFEALEIMERREQKISLLPVVSGSELKLLGVLSIHDLIQLGITL
jgi:arabinose-5-phosphate isomerase